MIDRFKDTVDRFMSKREQKKFTWKTRERHS